MPNIGLRDSLRKIGEPRSGKSILRFPSDFYSSPSSLKAAMHAMNPPLIERWMQIHETKRENKKWTEECQGITSDGKSWFLVSNNKEVKAVYKFSFEFALRGSTPPGGTTGVWPPELFAEPLHIGSPNYYKGKIYVPLEPSAAVWILDTNLKTLDVKPLGGSVGSTKQGSSMPWCAINPWNECLYSSTFNDVDRIYAYDLVGFGPVKEKDIVLQGGAIHRIQGGCFSANGHLYLTSDDAQQIRAYSALNGAFLGYKWVDYDKSWPDMEELEGISIVQIPYPEGATHVHVVVLDVDEVGNNDDIFFKHYSVPEPDVL